MPHTKHMMLVQLDVLVASFQDLSNTSRLQLRKRLLHPAMFLRPASHVIKMLVEVTSLCPERSFRARRLLRRSLGVLHWL